MAPYMAISADCDPETLAAHVERVGLRDEDFSREHAAGWEKLVYGE